MKTIDQELEEAYWAANSAFSAVYLAEFSKSHTASWAASYSAHSAAYSSNSAADSANSAAYSTANKQEEINQQINLILELL